MRYFWYFCTFLNIVLSISENNWSGALGWFTALCWLLRGDSLEDSLNKR